MTDELDQIPWHTFYQGYPAPIDTAQKLRNLINPDPTVIDKAHSELLDSIFRYTSISAHAVAAFPYLFQLMLTANGRTLTHVSDLVLRIIEGISRPYPSIIHWSDVLSSIDHFYHMSAAARATIYPIVIQNFSTLLRLLHDPDEDIAHKTLRIVVYFVAADSTLWSQTYQYAVAERRPFLRAGYQLIAWASASPVALAWVAETFEQAQEPLVKLTAALVIAQTVKPVPEAIYVWLIDTILLNDLTLIESYNALGLTRRYWFDCAFVLHHRPLSERTPLTEQCLAYLDLEGTSFNQEDYRGLVILAFGAFQYRQSAIERADIHSKVVLWLAQKAFVTFDTDYGSPLRILQDFRLPWRPSTVNGYLRLPNATHPGFPERIDD